MANSRRVWLNPQQTNQLLAVAMAAIDMEIRAAKKSSAPGDLIDLKRRVLDHLEINLPWWDSTWVDYPSECCVGGVTQATWSAIRYEFSRTHTGYAIIYDTNPQTGRPIGTWQLINKLSEARDVMRITLEDNLSRTQHDTETFAVLYGSFAGDALLEAFVKAPAAGHQMAVDIINASIEISDYIAGNNGAVLSGALGWKGPNDAIDHLERKSGGHRNAATRSVGALLWLEYDAKVP